MINSSREIRTPALTLFSSSYLMILFVVLSLTINLNQAQASPAAVITEQDSKLDLFDFTDIFTADSTIITAEALTTPQHQKYFLPLRQFQQSLVSGFSPYWLSFALINNSDKDRNYWLELDSQSWQETTLYVANEDASVIEIQRVFNGANKLPALVNISISAREQQRYFVLVKGSPTGLKISLNTAEQYLSSMVSKTGWASMGIGAFLVLVMLNCLFASIGRSMPFLFHSLYLLAITGTVATLYGSLTPLFTKFNHWQNPALCSLVFMASMALIHFSERLLSHYYRELNWRRLIATLLLINVVIFLYCLFYRYSNNLLFIMLLLGKLTFVFTLMAIHIRHRDPFAITMAICTSAAITLILLIYAASSLDVSNLDPNAFTASVLLIESSINTIALLLRGLKQHQSRLHNQHVIGIAEAENRSQSDIFARISHDIRTPISGVLGMSELLLDTPLNDQQRDHVRTIENSGRALLQLVNDVIDQPYIANDNNTQVNQFDIVNLLQETADSFRIHAEAKDVELLTDVAETIPSFISCDETRTRQLLVQLIKLAFSKTQEGEIIISLDFDNSTQHLIISIDFSGIKLNNDELQLLTDQANTSLKHDTKQLLNFNISNRIIKQLGGDIEVRQAPDKQIIKLTIPVQASNTDFDSDADLLQVLKQRRILVVDDNETCCKLIRQHAYSWQMQADIALSGSEALANIRSQYNLNEPYDIIIIDQNMPGMTGFQLAQKIHTEAFEMPPKMIMMTGLRHIPNSDSIHTYGISRVMTKPVTGKALKICLAEELQTLKSEQHELLASTTQTSIQAYVLIAEDNPVSQKVIGGMLKKLGAQSRIVSNGSDAVDAVKTEDFDLILMDCEMPIMDGFQASKTIRDWEQHYQRTPIPIVALTAHVLDSHKEQSLASGMDAHLTKPLNVEELREVLLRWAFSAPEADADA